MDLSTALQEVLRVSLVHDGLSRGIHECCQALDKRQAIFCVLAKNIDEANMTKLITALCSEHNIPLVQVDDNKKLGEMAGLCKIDREGKPRKVTACSVVVVREYGIASQAQEYMQDHLKKL